MAKYERHPSERDHNSKKQHLNFFLEKAEDTTGWRGPWAAPYLQGVILGVLSTEEIKDLPRLGNRPQKAHTYN